MVLQPRRQPSSYSLPWELQILHVHMLSSFLNAAISSSVVAYWVNFKKTRLLCVHYLRNLSSAWRWSYVGL
jgi:hypothetical protein